MAILKKKTFGYSERIEITRENFIREIEKLNPKDIVYSDEAGMDDNDIKITGWAKKGERLHDMKKAERKKRINFISALNLKNLIAPFIFEGPCTREVYETYLEKVLIPQLKPNQVLIIDNASFHKGGKIKELIESVKCRLFYLPTYSPDLNPIEKCWATIKNKIRTIVNQSNDIYEAAINVFQNY